MEALERIEGFLNPLENCRGKKIWILQRGNVSPKKKRPLFFPQKKGKISPPGENFLTSPNLGGGNHFISTFRGL